MTFLGRLRSKLKGLGSNSEHKEEYKAQSVQTSAGTFPTIQNPVNDFYEHRLNTSLADFGRFALQSKSLAIRDVFARVASHGLQNLEELLVVLATHDQRDLQKTYKIPTLLALADLLVNSARTDLDTAAALQIYDFVYSGSYTDHFSDQQLLQYLEALGDVERYDDISTIRKQLSSRDLAPLQFELLDVQRQRTISVSSWLNSLNELYSSLGMSRISLSNDESLPLFDRLESNINEQVDGPRISVVMPTFSPGPGIYTAVRSILQQTWKDLEVIIVDDASPKNFQHIFFELQEMDSRVRVIRQEENRGAYEARNTGLSLATGKFVIAHDDDDWSHPDKFALQARALENYPEAVATTSAHIRSTQNMLFRRVNLRAHYMQMNYSSLMFRKSITQEIGIWDTVNRGGDSEFLMRVIENYGAKNVINLKDKPLSFSRVWTGSLTSGEMSRGYFSYSRLLYRWAFRQWQWDMRKRGLRVIRNTNEPRPYAVPTTFEPGSRNSDLGLFDVIYVTDYFRQAKFVDFAMKDIEGLVNHGFRVGFMQLNSPQTNRPAGFPPKLFTLQRDGYLVQVAHDDIAETKLLIMCDASIGMFLDEMRSSVVSRRSILIEHELPALSGREHRSPASVMQSLRHIDNTFDTTFEVVGATRSDHDRLRQQIPTQRLLPESLIWSAHLNGELAPIRPPESKPLVGFHSYGNQYRWPSSDTVFSELYVSSEYKTRLYGNVRPAKNRFGDEIFKSIEIVDLKRTSEQDFLRSIDFWVYFPHDRLKDQVWEPVLRAMEAGKVVILPPRLECLYGEAAVYGEPEEINTIIRRLSKDPWSYTDQARRAQNLVENSFSEGSFIRRILSLLDSQ